jgi:Branched-chain amino acid ABC-type transport system, permease components
LLGGYVALSVIGTTGSWLLSIPIATLTIAVVGLIMERLFLRPEGHAKLVRDALIALGIALVIRLMIGPILPQLLPGQIGNIIQVTLVVIVFAIPIFLLLQRISAVAIEADTLRQVLMTVGFAFLFQQAALDIWGGNNFDIQPPSALTQSLVIGGTYLPLYRLFMIAGALVIGVALWLAMEKTRMGASVRATVDDAQMARGVGIDTNRFRC